MKLENENMNELKSTQFIVGAVISQRELLIDFSKYLSRYEHENAVKHLKERMKRGDTYIEDSWFGHWGYNPKDNSTTYLGKYFENEKDAWTTFKQNKQNGTN